MRAGIGNSITWRQSSYFYYTLIISLCLIYFGIQCSFISYQKLAVDDLWLSYHTWQFKSFIPYRDFSPYKTTLGYYVLLIPLSLFHGVIKPLLYTKITVAFINAGLMAVTALWLRKYFSAFSIISSVMLMIFTEFFLNYSAEIRVDMLAYWVCLISILFIFENKFIWAGIVSGLSFAISQKVLWYVIAINSAFGCYWIYQAYSLKMLRQIVLYNIATLVVIITYIAFWAQLSSLHTVLHNVFYEAYLVFSLDSYSTGRILLWHDILLDNPFYFMIVPLAWISLLVIPEQDKQRELRLFITVLATVILFSIVSYKQPFPYNMLATFPAFLVLYAALFSWLQAVFQGPSFRILFIKKSGIFSLLMIYILGLVFLMYYFALPAIAWLICLIPALLAIHINSSRYGKEFFVFVVFTVLLTGVIFPAVRFVKVLPELNGHYQKYILDLTDKILATGGDYVAGVALFYNKNLPIPGLKHIVVPLIDYLNHPAPELLPVMNLPSLYIAPVTSEQIISSLENSSVKLYVNNERLRSIPLEIRNYLDTQYQHYWGSIYLYAPLIEAGINTVRIKFAGKYQVKSSDTILFDNIEITSGTTINLEARQYVSDSKHSYRLILIPEIDTAFLKPEYKNDNWQSVLE